MWWKIYFGITIIEVLSDVLSFFIFPEIHIVTHIVLSLIFIIAAVGLYGYIFQKNILSQVFWQYFLGIYILIDILYLIYTAAPSTPFISGLSFMEVYKSDNFSLINAAIGTIIDIPLLYALYRMTKGELYQPKQKKKENTIKWGMIQTALWGYSSVLTFFLFILAFFPTNGSDKKADPTDPIFIACVFAPLLIFWLMIIFRYKRYKWNWWRTTLVANALLYSGSIIFSVFTSSSNQISSGFDFIAILQLLILLLSLYVFGKDQFNQSAKQSNKILT